MELFDFAIEESAETKKIRETICKELLLQARVQAFLRDNLLDERFVYDHAFKLQDYIKQVGLCDNCAGLDFCMQTIKGHVYELQYDNLRLNTVLSPCQFQKSFQQSIAHQSYILINDMSQNQLQYRFDSIDFSKESDSYLAIVHGLLHSMKSPVEKGFYLCGDPGVGKTYLSCCVANDYASKGVATAFVHVPTLVADLKSMMYEQRVFKQVIARLRQVDVLILDDIGGESASSWSRDDILLPLLNERMEKRKKTYFTSNYTFKDIEKFYTLKSNTINDQVGSKRLVERMKALSLEKVLQTKNRRV